MKQHSYRRWLGLLIAGLAVLVLALVTFDVAASVAQPTEPAQVETARVGVAAALSQAATEPLLPSASSQTAITSTVHKKAPPRGPKWETDASTRPTTPGNLEITLLAITGLDGDQMVYNGDRMTYTLTVMNSGGAPATNIILYNLLPEGLGEIQCVGECGRIIETELLPTPLGGFVTVSVTTGLTWPIPSLAPAGVTETAFTARVVGRPDGAVIRNAADLEYDDGIALSNETETTVRVRVDEDGQATLADVPTWLSTDLGGTMSLDWGDFDGDGYLDLALGSTVGTSVYRNEGGHLSFCWDIGVYTLGVRWADIDGDGDLELVAVGDSDDKTAASPGTNYVFDPDPDCTTPGIKTFSSDHQLLRVEPAEYSNEGQVALVASTNAIDVPCPVRLIEGNGQGGFADSFVDSPTDFRCVSGEASANMAPADYDKDGDPDLALGGFPNRTELAVNDSCPPAACWPPFIGSTLLVPPATAFLAYDFAWGDYDRDGYLDFAAAFPLERKVRLYRSLEGETGGFQPVYEFQTTLFRTPQAVEWGDFDGNGYLDLAVADTPPKIYFNRYGSFLPTDYFALSPELADGQIWAMAAADADNDGDLDLALGNWKGASLLFTTFGPFLDSSLSGIGSFEAGGVAWGDPEADGDQDLLFGSGGLFDTARVYDNRHGLFSLRSPLDARHGPHSVAFGDVDGDTLLDIALGSVWLGDRIYLASDRPTTGEWPHAYVLSSSSNSLAWGDVEGDGDLDLLAGTEGANALYLNGGTGLDTTPAWTSLEVNDTRSVAWADFDRDGFLDFAAGNDGQPNQVYRNNGDQTFSLAWSALTINDTRSVAWGDLNADGYPDLAVGNYGQPNLLYENQDGSLSPTPIQFSDVVSKSTSLAWGDWDNDGDLDLAVGNDGEPDQVYTNQGSTPGSPRLLWLWTSREQYETSGVAWGDRDGDGDLELAISQSGNGQNGFYENNYVLPAHLGSGPAAMTLPQNPSYVVITRPGTIDDAYFQSSWELLAYPSPPAAPPTVTVPYALFDPDGDPISGLRYNYSLDGGGTWVEAGDVTSTLSTAPLGLPATFDWNAREEEAISDDARFRITIIHQNPVGPVQRASTSASSPPFRVRGTTCMWPVEPSIIVVPDPPLPHEEVTFEGALLVGEGPLIFDWDFGDGTQGQGQVVAHTYPRNGAYSVTLTVTSEPCPEPGVVKTTQTIIVGSDVPPLFIPYVSRSAAGGGVERDTPVETRQQPELSLAYGSRPETPLPMSEEADEQPSSGPEGTTEIALAPEAASAGSNTVFPPTVSTIDATKVPSITAESGIHGHPSISGDGRRIAFWSTGDLELEQCSQRPLAEIGPILLVDDDDNFPDVRSFYVDTLNALGATFDVWDTNNSLIEPDLATLSLYSGVVWFSGDAYGGTGDPRAGPLPATEVALTSFLDAGGFLFITSQDYLYDRGLTSFISTHLGVSSYSNDVEQTTVAGSGSVFSVLGLYSLAWWPPDYEYNYSDRVSPDGTAELAFSGDRGHAAVNKETGAYRTTFWGYGFEGLPGVGAREESMRAALLWLGFGCKLTAFNDDGNIEAFLAEVDDSETVDFAHLTASRGSILGGFNLWPSISADGDRVALFSDWDLVAGGNPDNSFEIFMVEAGSGGGIATTQVTSSTGGANLWPSINVTGTHIAFASDRDLDPRKLNGDGNQEIYLAEIATDGTISLTQITETAPPVINDQPSVSGDSDHIAFVRHEGGEAHLWLYDGTANTEILSEGINVQPALGRGATHIAFASNQNLDPKLLNDDGNQEIYLAEIGAKSVTYTQVTSTSWPIVNDQPSICAQGKRVAFVSGSQVWLYDNHAPAKGILLSEAGDATSRPTISAGGTYVAFAADNDIYRAFSPLTDLSVTKQSAPIPIVPGDNMTYTLTFVNHGELDVSGATISDTVPSAVFRPSWQCAPDPCTKPSVGQHLLSETVNISAGASLIYTASGRLRASVPGIVVNTAEVTPPPGTVDQDTSDNRVTLTDTLSLVADLAVSKVAEPDTVNAGEVLTYTLVYTNDGGPSYAWDLVISDRLPRDVEFGGMVTGDDPSSQSGRLLTWNVTSLAVDTTGRLEFTATVASSVLSDTITNTVAIAGSSSDPNPDNNDDLATTTVDTTANLVVAKIGQPDPVLPGATLVYTLVYTNYGPSDAQDVTITDVLPPNVTWDGTVLAQDPSLDGPNLLPPATWEWTKPSLAAGASGSIVFEVTVSGALVAPETIVNTAEISSSTHDDDPNNVATAPVDVVILVDLAVQKTAVPDPVDAGANIAYTILVSNLSNVTVSGAAVLDQFPPELEAAEWSCTPSPGSTCTPSSGPTTGINDVVTLAPNGLLTYIVTGKLKPSTANDVANTAGVAVPPGFVDTNPLDNYDTFTSIVNLEADLAVSKSVDDLTPNQGDTIIYTLVINNTIGPSDAPNVVLTDPLPAGLVNPIGTTNHGTYDSLTGVWSAGTVPYGTTASLQVSVEVVGTGSPTIVNSVEGLSSTATDPVNSNNTDSATITVNFPPSASDANFSVPENSPDGISVGTVTASDPNPGDTQSFSITAGNTGSAFAVNSANGLITVADGSALDHETKPTFNLTVQVEDSGGLTDDASVTINVTDVNEAPAVTTSSPGSGSTYVEGATINFAGAASDPEDGDISANLSWESSIDGGIGTGASFSRSDLSVGTHSITASVTDSGGLSGNDIVSITVNATTAPTSAFGPGGSNTFANIIANSIAEGITLPVLNDDAHIKLTGPGDWVAGGFIPGQCLPLVPHQSPRHRRL